MNELCIRNHQRVRTVNVRLLRKLILTLVRDVSQIERCALGLHIVGKRKMAELNLEFLHHEGSTDVITFDYSDAAGRGILYGEIFVSMDDAVEHARVFHTSWPSELVRYIVHGVLHLRGFDDTTASARRTMKRIENRLVEKLRGRFAFARLARRARSRSRRGNEAETVRSRKNPASLPRRLRGS